MALERLGGATLRPRAGGERFQRVAGGIPRSLKKQFQAAGIGPADRQAPLLCLADGTLAWVSGLGVDARALARPGEPQVTLRWHRGGWRNP